MALKIDLEKVYDKLERNFIRDMLIRVNLSMDIIDVITSCVSTVSTSILFNGEALDPIFASRGIRQGDPISPYLFILCMDYLGQLIEEKCSGKLWQPVKASQSGLAFSHLFFAEDLILFAKADRVNCVAIRDVLDIFCSIYVQTVSEDKSREYFSPNVDRDARESLCDILGFASMPYLGKYLGFLLKQPGSSSHDYNFILDKVKQKLFGWKANLLSLASCRVLIQSSLATIPSYIMQCFYLLGRVLDGLDRVNRNFLWGSTESAKKIHWLGWEKDWEKLTFELPDEVKGLICAIPISTLGGGSEKLAWAGSSNGSFDVKSAYGMAMESSNDISFSASWIWKADLLPKVRLFLWLCAYNSISVKVCLGKRGVVQDEVCPVCCNGVETILHALKDCSHLNCVWNQLGVTASNYDFWHVNLLDWLSLNVRTNDKLHVMGTPWKIMFAFAL
ncbi:uncharacterized protein LOC112040610 [Quercus suber]|uniref:uncharacterized protein LOC112040610 n=1 Tax=Quercus suber TaxID=58331 RepID=UPI0032DF5252